LPDQPNLEFNQRDLGHGASETVLHPAVMVALLIAIALMLWRPRKYAAIPLMMAIFLIPRGQQILFAGVHWYVRLILILVGFARFAQAKFQIAGGMNGVDKAFILWALYRTVAVTLTNLSTWPNGAAEHAAFLLQACCGYFLLRYLIQDEKDIARAAKALAVVTVILGACMLNERLRGVNVFGYLGGAPLIPEIRNGMTRAQATFGHSILAGCFGATLLPLFFWVWKSDRGRVLAAVGMAGSTLMVLMSNSSTPVLAYVAGVGALFLWPIRRSMRAVRWGIVLTIAGLAIVMKAPVWFLVARVNVIGGSGGYDRAFLIDTCIRHLRDWWLIGTNQNGMWGYDMWDLSDQFVAEAEMGGLLTLVCFIAIISRSFGRLGRMRKQVERKEQWLLWCLGAVMLAHIFAYFGVSYWDQNQIWWFAFLAMISAATAALQEAPAKAQAESSGDGAVLEPAPAGSGWEPELHSQEV
jgi:hypothetical protein